MFDDSWDAPPMSWIVLTIASALLLGVYDIAKKVSVRHNAVPIVLLVSVCFGAVLWLPLLILSHTESRDILPASLRVTPLSTLEHGLLIAKSLLVGMSWTFAFFAMKHLPLSIASPIRSTSPLWTILIATMALGERPTLWQWTGMIVVLLSFWRFSTLGAREGIRFSNDRFVLCMVIATLLGALSSIYDKLLLQNMAIEPATVQAWFTIYLVPVMLPLALRWFRRDREQVPFQFRRSIFWISPLLLVADFLYFTALAEPDALVSIVSTVRRCSVLIPFLFGIRALGEANFRSKAVCVVTMLIGVGLLTWR
jgi:bacterial/archaeal transporter family protein